MSAGPISHTVSRSVSCPVERLFDVVVAEDVLPKVLHRHLLLPAVIGTAEVSGPWNEPGSQRRVLLGNGTSLREEVTGWERPIRFDYRVDEFPAPLRGIADHAEGHWEFASSLGAARFEWTYVFYPTGRVARAPLAAFVRGLWSGYMARCADRCAELAHDT